MALNPNLLAMVSKAKGKYAGNSGKALKPKEGRNTYRIIAPHGASWIGAAGEFWADLGVHWIKADPNGKPIAVVGDCDTVYQQPSLIAAAIDAAIASAVDEDSKKLYEEWRARRSVLVNVLDRNDKSMVDPQPLELTPTTWGKVLDLIQMHAEAGQDITDPDNGVDIVISRTGKGLNTEYTIMVAPGVSQPVPKDVVNRAVDLPEFIARNYFRGEETKALNAIVQISGVNLPRLGGPVGSVRTPTAALTSASASVEGAEIETTPAPKAPAGPTPEEKALADRRAAILKRQQEDAAELAALSSPAAKAPEAAAPAAASIASLPDDEQDALLAELDGLIQ